MTQCITCFKRPMEIGKQCKECYEEDLEEYNFLKEKNERGE